MNLKLRTQRGCLSYICVLRRHGRENRRRNARFFVLLYMKPDSAPDGQNTDLDSPKLNEIELVL